MKIGLANYKNSKSIFAKTIKFQQKYLQKLGEESKYSHSEVWIEYNPEILRLINNYTIQFHGYFGIYRSCYLKSEYKKHGLWISSDEADGGVRFKIIHKNEANWDIDYIEIDIKRVIKGIKYAKKFIGKPYGISSIFFGQILNTLWNYKQDDLFCSQFCTKIFKEMGVLDKHLISITINPGELNKIWNNGKVESNNTRQAMLVVFIFILIILLIGVFF